MKEKLGIEEHILTERAHLTGFLIVYEKERGIYISEAQDDP